MLNPETAHPIMYFIPVEKLSSCLNAFRQPKSINPKNFNVEYHPHQFIFIQRQDLWADEFMKHAMQTPLPTVLLLQFRARFCPCNKEGFLVVFATGKPSQTERGEKSES